MNHWHIQRPFDVGDPFVTLDIYGALDYAATELSQIADFEHEGITACGESGDFEGAYRAWKDSERYGNLESNAKNVVRQNSAPADERAPLYQGEDWQDRLAGHAKWVVDEINGKGPNQFVIWECGHALVTLDEGTPDEQTTCSEYVY